MKEHLKSLLVESIRLLRDEGALALDAVPEIPVERSRGSDHGEFASAVALGLAKLARKKPRDIAQAIVERMPASPRVVRAEVAGPGFINFFLAADAFASVVGDILEAPGGFGRAESGAGRRVQVEFVSANPTGPLHVGHGRGAAYGAAIANLLEATGHDVQREYYVNDAGRQMDILAVSVWLRYLEALGEPVAFPSNGYRGEYVREISAALLREHGNAMKAPWSAVAGGLPADEPEGGDKEAHVDGLIAQARSLLGPERYHVVYRLACDTEVDEIRDDLRGFRIEFDEWFSEHSLMESGAVSRAIEALRERGHIYEADGAQWFRSTTFGDEKDRVVVRENGESTYFASDIAYAANKFERGFERAIYVWGADHHGYVARVNAAVTALGYDAGVVEILLVQFANLYRGDEKVQMSTRSGEFVTLRQLRDEVGEDAARFFYSMRRCEQHLDFDLELAKSRSNENPVYYVQYAHARIRSVIRQAGERGFVAAFEQCPDLGPLAHPSEQSLMRTLARYPEVVEAAAAALEPHQITAYLREVATEFHGYYNDCPFLVDDEPLRDARLALCLATGEVLALGLGLVGVAAPESM